MPLSYQKIGEILDQFDAMFDGYMAKKKHARPEGCVLCRRADRRDIGRTILEGILSQSRVAEVYGVEQNVIRHHKMHCLVKFGGATFTDFERSEERRHQLFPISAREATQKLFVLKELLFVRDESLKKTPVDRKEIARLIKDIDAAADVYRAARKAEKKTGKKVEPDNLDDEFTAEQRAEMSLVNKKIAEGSNGGPRQAE